MFFSKRSIVSVTLLGGAVGITSWLTVKSIEGFIVGGSLPDSFQVNQASQIEVVQLDKKGGRQYVLHASQMTRYADDHADADTVKVLSYATPEAEPWRMQAGKANMDDSNEKLGLSEGVVIKRDRAGKKVPPIKIVTNSGMVYPKINYVKTDQPVVMTQPGSPNMTTGVGLEGYLSPADLTLQSNVRTYYVRQDGSNQ